MVEFSPEATRDHIRYYLQNNPDLNENEEAKTLNLTDPQEFGDKMTGALRSSVDLFLASSGGILIGGIMLDETIPISMNIYKAAKSEEGKKVADILFFEIEKQDEKIGEFALRDYGNEFRLSHRKINPRYRGGEISSYAMRGIEEFVKEYVRRSPQREAVIHSNAAQLNVISWFLKHGYEPTDDDFPNQHGVVRMHNLDAVLDSLEQQDGKYTVSPGEFLYVFPGDFQGPHLSVGGTTPEEINIDASALVHLKKELKVDSDPSFPIQTAQNSTRERLGLH